MRWLANAKHGVADIRLRVLVVSSNSVFPACPLSGSFGALVAFSRFSFHIPLTLFPLPHSSHFDWL